MMKRLSRLQTRQPTWSCHKLMCKLCRILPTPAMLARHTVFLASRPCGWLALLLTKVGDVETNPGPIIQTNESVFAISAINKQMLGRYQDLSSTQRIQAHNSHRHNTTSLLQTLVQAVGRHHQQQEVQQL